MRSRTAAAAFVTLTSTSHFQLVRSALYHGLCRFSMLHATKLRNNLSLFYRDSLTGGIFLPPPTTFPTTFLPAAPASRDSLVVMMMMMIRYFINVIPYVHSQVGINARCTSSVHTLVTSPFCVSQRCRSIHTCMLSFYRNEVIFVR